MRLAEMRQRDQTTVHLCTQPNFHGLCLVLSTYSLTGSIPTSVTNMYVSHLNDICLYTKFEVYSHYLTVQMRKVKRVNKTKEIFQVGHFIVAINMLQVDSQTGHL